ncbi:MAG: hypothetical protein ABW171_14480 [Steroidobacter sp.]
MNKLTKTLSIAAATMLLAAPLTSQASNDDVAMDACINAFVAASLPKEQPVKVRKEEVTDSPISVHARVYKIVVNATGVESGKRLARGECIVNRAGEVIALNGKPVSTRLAAR